MGWLSYHRAKGESNLDHFRRQFDGERGRVLDCATVGNVAYIAYCVQPKDRSPYVGALVVLTQWVPRPADGMNFAYKDQDESMGPTQTRCPQRILDQLSPLAACPYGDDGRRWASEWREACAAYLAARAARRGIGAGATVKFAAPLTFTDGSCADTLVWTGTGSIFRDPQTGQRLRVTNWRDRAFDVVATSA